MKSDKLLILITLIGLISCGSGSSDNSTPPPEPNNTVSVPEVINDLTCGVSYPIAIAAAYLESNNADIPMLYDGDKTNTSRWKSPSIDSNIIIELAAPAQLKEMVITWQDMEYAHLFKIYAAKTPDNWQLLDSQEQSTKQSLIPDLIHLSTPEAEAVTAKFIKIELAGNEVSQPSDIVELEVFGCAQEVSHNIELVDWYLSIPTDEDNNGKSDSIKENDLSNHYFDPRFFGLSSDGGLRFSTSVSGYKTSTNTKYVRSELREMLRRGNTNYKTQGVNPNNWVFSTAPQSDLKSAGGIDGQLNVELAVNHVTSTGEDYQIGRVIIGQIHANDDEPARLYYRKLPGNSHGAIYLAHEILGGDDIYYEIIGSRSNSASNDEQGIPLNEKFSYTIAVSGHELTITIVKSNGTEFKQIIDMSQSGYDQGGQYMYFKAGVYNQNNSGDPHDYVQATFYQIDNSHSSY